MLSPVSFENISIPQNIQNSSDGIPLVAPTNNWHFIDSPLSVIQHCNISKRDCNNSQELDNNFDTYSRQFLGIKIADKKGNYLQILPSNIFKNASKNFKELKGDAEKSHIIELLSRYEGNLVATSTIFAILAYGVEFAKNLVHEDDGAFLKNALDKGDKFIENQQNFQQEYLNTCAAASTFTVLADLFHNNAFILSKIMEFELKKIENKEIMDPNSKAYHTINPFAPTIQQEVQKRIRECKDIVGKVNGGSLSNGSNQEMLAKLSNVFEKISSIQNPSSPILITQRLFQNFPISCITSFGLIFFAKIFTLGLYTGSAKFSERFQEITSIPNNIAVLSSISLDDNDPQNKTKNFNENTWNDIHENGSVTATKNGRLCDHAIAIKACIDSEGKKYFEIHNPTEKEAYEIDISGNSRTSSGMSILECCSRILRYCCSEIEKVATRIRLRIANNSRRRLSLKFCPDQAAATSPSPSSDTPSPAVVLISLKCIKLHIIS